MRASAVILVAAVMLTFVSCSSTDPSGDIGEKIELTHHAGSIGDGEWNFLPYPAHFGYLDGMPTFVLSKSNSPGSSRMVQRIATLDIVQDGAEQRWIIAIDTHPSYQIDNLQSAKDLMTTHSGIRSTLERWITYHKGLGTVQIKGWKAINTDD